MDQRVPIPTGVQKNTLNNLEITLSNYDTLKLKVKALISPIQALISPTQAIRPNNYINWGNKRTMPHLIVLSLYYTLLVN